VRAALPPLASRALGWLRSGRGAAGAAGALTVAALVLCGCVSGSIAGLPAPPAVPATSPTTTLPDLAGVSLNGVAGQTTTTAAAIGPGQATLTGTVSGPQGAVPGAVVEVNRVTRAGNAIATTTTNPDGTWTVAGILGGAYRVRAWRAPDLSMTTPTELFLSSTETRQVQLQVQAYGGVSVTASVAPDPPVVGQPANLVIELATTSVDSQTGVVRSTGVSGAQVELTGPSTWALESPNPTITDASGMASWELYCEAAGSAPLAVQVTGGSAYQLSQPTSCVEAASTTTTSTTRPSTSSTLGRSSTTSTSTTSTTTGR